MKKVKLHINFALLFCIALSTFYGCTGKRANWRETYLKKSKQPYGTFIITELLASYFPEQNFTVLEEGLKDELDLDNATRSNYVFIGEALYLDSIDRKTLMNFIYEGNVAFISSRTLPYDLMDSVYVSQCFMDQWEDYEEVLDTTAELRLLHPDLDFDAEYIYKFVRRNQVYNYYWQYVSDAFFCEEAPNIFPLGHMSYLGDSLVNFIKVAYGQGQFFLHTTPIAFTNFSLLDSFHLQYADKVFSHLPEGPIYWDSYSKIPEALGRRLNRSGNSRLLSSESPLQYILSQPALTWAWYMLLAMGVLYLLFRSKRRQRVIPVKDPNTNTSLEFLGIMSRLYFMQQNHKHLALQKMKLFRSFVNDRYNLQIKNLEEPKNVEKLVAKSTVDFEILKQIRIMNKNIQGSSFVSENTLIDFHNTMDKFYQNCK